MHHARPAGRPDHGRQAGRMEDRRSRSRSRSRPPGIHSPAITVVEEELAASTARMATPGEEEGADGVSASTTLGGSDSASPDETIKDEGEEASSKASAPMYNLYATSMSYNGYTITDGALRLIILLHADSLGFTPIEIALMFSLYEVAGIVTNFFGSLCGARYGLQCTLLSSLFLQILCLGGLMAVEPIFGQLDENIDAKSRTWATVYITAFQAFAGIAKDFMKLTGKSTPKLVTKDGEEGSLFRFVAWLTGCKNALKGFGSLMGAVLVESVGFIWSLFILMIVCAIFVPVGLIWVDSDLGKGITKEIDWHSVFHKGYNVNVLSAARFFLFASRDLWFEIGLPLYLKGAVGWSDSLVGLVMGFYIVAYGGMQAATTGLYSKESQPTIRSVPSSAFSCSVVTLLMGTSMYIAGEAYDDMTATAVLCVIWLVPFAGIFALCSTIHSYLIVSFSNRDKVAESLGYYYASNAGGRLVGTVLGGVIYQYSNEKFGLSMCLWVATPFLVAAGLISLMLKEQAGSAKEVRPPSPSLAIV
jgi:hypothetical protein